MTYNTPLRLTILHLAQRFLIEEDTFMIPFSLFGMNLSDQIPGVQKGGPTFTAGRLAYLIKISSTPVTSAKYPIIPALALFVQSDFINEEYLSLMKMFLLNGPLWQGQNQRLVFSNSHTMLEMSCQRAIG